MKAYKFPGYIVTSDEPIDGYEVMWELSDLQAELCRAGGSCVFEHGTLTIIPAPPVIAPLAEDISKIQFLKKLSLDERISVRELGKTDPVVSDFLDLLSMSESINMADEDFIRAMGYLQYLGVLTAERIQVIFE